MYSYKNFREKIIHTENGQNMLEQIKNNAISSNEAYMNFGILTKNVCGDSWMMLGCIDRLEELGVIQLVAKGMLAQYNMYILN